MHLRTAISRGTLVAFCAIVSANVPVSSEEKPLTNEDVIQLVRLGLGDQVAIAKIKQVRSVDFHLDTDALVGLKKSGVSPTIIQAMLEKESPPPAAAPPGPPTGLESILPTTDKISVRLATAQGEQALHLARGQMSTTGFGLALTHMDYPGLNARIRTSDPTLHLLVQSEAQIEGGRYFLVKLDRDQDDVCRSLKIGSFKQRLSFKMKKALQPDKDWVIPCDISEAQPGMWRVQPRSPLSPGEYGFYIDPQLMNMYFQFDSQAGGIFDFGVDNR